MQQCLTCKTTYPSSDNTCHSCGFAYEMLDGFPAYSPSLAYEGPGFNPTAFADLANLEANNFWFRARNRLIIWALGHYAPKFRSFLEIGCGTGYVLSGIAKAYPNACLKGSELFIKGLAFAANRLPSASLIQMDARNIPFFNEFDSIGAFDVLEHIEEDKEVLTQIYQALKPEGILILTVPQHNWLWSPVDDYACHVRRYNAKDLHTKLKDANFEVLRSTSFVTSLLPAMLTSRFIQRVAKNNNPTTDFNIPSWLNSIFERMLNGEMRLIRKGINYPVGGSRLVVARKLKENN